VKKVARVALTATVGARVVKASLDGNGAIFQAEDTATIRFSLGTLTVEKERVRLSDEELCKIPPAAETVQVDFTNHTLTITADGEKVFESGASKRAPLDG
jgi:hypothetical protein